MEAIRPEAASFRDPASAVFYAEGRVLRGLSETAAADWESASGSEFLPRLMHEGRVVATAPAPADVVARLAGSDWKAVLEHERIPFVSYPYEWTFSMLRDAAQLQLEILLAALDEGMTLKDGYAFNVQWRGARPVFIDTPSFERLGSGGPWAGYRQFCQTFLFPLMLQAYKDIPFQPFLRAELDGLEPGDMRKL